ncbi:hypothetical protein VTO42DRAFT_6131 [Malbranchea cinnamomea]
MAGPPPQDASTVLASIFFGLFWGLFAPTALKAAHQTWRIWKRTRSFLNAYLWMIWVEALVNLFFATITYLYVSKVIPGDFVFFFFTVVLWSFQTQLLLQIIANRVSLVMIDRRKSLLLRWALFIIIFLINISVFCIWIPALMNVNATFIRINYIWERVEKGLFLVVDFSLNLFFLYLVRSDLIAKGLTKYWSLFKFNCGAVVVSVSMDALLLGILNLPNPYDYVQFAPVAYTVKLNIELTMAELISKIVRNSQHRVDNHDSSTGPTARISPVYMRLRVAIAIIGQITISPARPRGTTWERPRPSNFLHLRLVSAKSTAEMVS